MTDICVTYLSGWYRFEFQELNWYAAGAGEIGKFWSWTLVEDMRQETLIDTTTMFNATSPVAQLPRPSSNVNATNFMGHQVPYPNPDLRNFGSNSKIFYPLQILQSPVQLK